MSSDELFHMNFCCFAYVLNRKNRPRNGGICVANHTSPIDVIILASDGYYAMVRLLSVAFLGHDLLLWRLVRAERLLCPSLSSFLRV